ncbi:hypothetical protein CCAL9344_00080 [Campylobacter sp. RM9344]|uniref:Chromosome segregation protein n=1 Tax=Campylobacter californiensis TaxID=1032243 RepID=A0AAW3ZSJ4_9BACT|nr:MULTISPECIES: hypothetical protein [unclassified Campylobacter]MBE2983746.1 hypothetical protein [Campylobacter sp. RM6883]MBE2994285.1 hypothetical protein [Campylobacter sp. RM6913]MBE3028593.1 hypothetical protein [Campylobacter sp. RM9344]MBE3607482.1 hypothetical protein [Campylobacter sp. RM9337]QCD50876.1 putative chromosome segregation protein [Campylobacter sp. RM6914]
MKLLVSAIFLTFFTIAIWIGLSDKNTEFKEGERQHPIHLISFENLPQEEKAKYISKDDLFEYGGYITPKSYTQNFVLNDETQLSTNVEELQSLVRELASKNAILAQDNIDMSEKNIEFISKVNLLKEEFENEKELINQKNSHNLTELEAQHFINIENITKRLNEAQADMIESSKAYEKKIVDLENALNELSISDKNYKAQMQEKFAKEKDQAEANISALSSQNIELLSKVKEQAQKIDELNENILQMRILSKNELETLQNELEQERNDASNLSFKHNKELRIITEGFETQRLVMEDELSKKANSVLDLKKSLEDTKTALDTSRYELKLLQKSLQAKDDTAKNYNGQNLELNASLMALKKEHETLKDRNLKTEEELKTSNAMVLSMAKDLEKLKLENTKFKELNAYADNDIKELKAKLSNAQKEFGELNAQYLKTNETLQKNAKNLNEQSVAIIDQNKKISETNLKLDEMTAKFADKQAEVKNLENNISELNLKLNNKQIELEAHQRSLKIDRQNYEILRQEINILEKKVEQNLPPSEYNATASVTIKSLKNELKEAKRLAQDSNETIKELTDKIKQLHARQSNSTSEQIAELQKDIEQNLDKQDALEDENAKLKMILEAQTKPEIPTKLVLISSLECIDMDARDKISVMCKNRVSEFLQRFTANYIYEITPIVDQKNFVIPQNVAQNIKKDELGRLNEYVNYGVGKERAKAAAELVKDEFGEFARISFSSEIIVKNNARGFVLKVYR